MTEAFLYHIWKYRLLNNIPLVTSEGYPIQIIKVGVQNHDAGPDFFNARIKIGDTEWAGNVEVDITTAHWAMHGHDKNDAFKKIILHVVYEITKPVLHNIPVLELKNYINADVKSSFEELNRSPNPIPCSSLVLNVSSITITSWLERMLIERLAEKTKPVEEELKTNHFNWEETFYHSLAKNFGFKTNALPFEMLAKSIPLNILARQKNNLLQLEALFLGQAGFLGDKNTDAYFLQLQKEYVFLSNKYSLKPLDKSIWKFARLRPVNFPTVRIAQFAALVHTSSHLFSKITETKGVKQLLALFTGDVSEYWKTHYHFAKKSGEKDKALGRGSIENILINTVVPFLYVYGKMKERSSISERALSLLEQLSPENNIIIKEWKRIGVNADSAWQTQGLIQLKNNFCSHKKCLQCAIGLKILNSGNGKSS